MTFFFHVMSFFFVVLKKKLCGKNKNYFLNIQEILPLSNYFTLIYITIYYIQTLSMYCIHFYCHDITEIFLKVALNTINLYTFKCKSI
jgi:hypothetical protein